MNKKQKLALIIGLMVLFLLVVGGAALSFLLNRSSQPITECFTDSDCVPSACCHPSSCAPVSLAPNCEGISCTQECAIGTLDCGQGSCSCINRTCQAVFN